MSSAEHPIFVTQIRAALGHWKAKSTALDDKGIAGLDAERTNLYRSIQYGLVLPDTWEDTAVVVHQTFPLIEWRGYWREWIPVLDKVIATTPPGEYIWQVRFLNQLGYLHALNRDLSASESVLWEAETIARRLGDNFLLAQTYANLSQSFFRQNRLEAAETYGQEGLSRLRQIENAEYWLANLLQTLGNIARWRQNGPLAQERLLAVVSIRRKLGASLPLARALNDLGMAYRLSGQRPLAYQTLCEAAELLALSLYELDISVNRLNTGCLYYDDRQWEKAEGYFRQADSSYVRRFASVAYRARVNHHIGNALLRQDKFQESAAYFEQAIILWRQAGDEVEWANTLDSLGEAREGLGEARMALQLYQMAAVLLQGYPDHERASHLLSEIQARPLYRASI
jgi:tetratricopeptide (TPR) repeat protein